MIHYYWHDILLYQIILYPWFHEIFFQQSMCGYYSMFWILLLSLFMKYSYSLRSAVVESFCHFGTLHSSWVISFYNKSQNISYLLLYSLLIYSFFISLPFSLFYFILPLFNPLNTIFLKSRAEKKCLYYRRMEGVTFLLGPWHFLNVFIFLEINKYLFVLSTLIELKYS